MEYTSKDIREEIEKLKELIEKNAKKEEIKAKQLELNQMLEEFLKDTK